MTFSQWWVYEIGHPPSNAKERFAFEMARKAWWEGERKILRALRDEVCPDCREKRPLDPALPNHPGYHRDGPDDKYPDRCRATPMRRRLHCCPVCKKDITQPRNPDGSDPAPCCNPQCGGIWGSSCYHCHLDGPGPLEEP